MKRKRPQKTDVQSAGTDLPEIWWVGLRLSDAAWEFSEPEEKEHYRKPKSQRSLEFEEDTRRFNLLRRIHDGRFFAIGIQTSPELRLAFEIIPSIIFSDPPDEIDWEKQTIRALGRTYERIRVVSPEQLPGETARVHKPRRRGRPSVEDELRVLVRELADKGQLRGISRKQQYALLGERARSRYPNSFRRPSQPSPTSMLRALKEGGF